MQIERIWTDECIESKNQFKLSINRDAGDAPLHDKKSSKSFMHPGMSSGVGCKARNRATSCSTAALKSFVVDIVLVSRTVVASCFRAGRTFVGDDGFVYKRCWIARKTVKKILWVQYSVQNQG